MLLKLAPILLIIGYALLMWRFSVWQTGRALAAQSAPLTDPDILRLTQRLALAAGIEKIDVQVYNIPAINGLATAEGKIYLTQGFLHQKLRGGVTADELAAVVAHELGHVAHGHMRRRMIDFTGQNAVFVLLSALLNRFLPFIGIFIARFISTALMARLSRRDEFEADAYATALLIKSGIGTAPQKSLFRKLPALTKGLGEGVPAWLLSHPKPEDRIAAIEANEARWTIPRIGPR